MISCTATTEPSAVPLVIAIILLVSGGMVRRTACGTITYESVCARDIPVERAASVCPFGTARMPAQKISSAKAASTRDNASHVAVKALIDRPTYGKAKK